MTAVFRIYNKESAAPRGRTRGQISQLTKALLKPEGVLSNKTLPSHFPGNYRWEFLLLVGPSSCQNPFECSRSNSPSSAFSFQGSHLCRASAVQPFELRSAEAERTMKGLHRISALEPWIGPASIGITQTCTVRLSVHIMLYTLNEAAEERRRLTSSSWTNRVEGGVKQREFPL